MYSVGYAGFYGLSICMASYTVLFVSIAAHAAQFGFLIGFENPRTWLDFCVFLSLFRSIFARLFES